MRRWCLKRQADTAQPFWTITHKSALDASRIPQPNVRTPRLRIPVNAKALFSRMCRSQCELDTAAGADCGQRCNSVLVRACSHATSISSGTNSYALAV